MKAFAPFSEGGSWVEKKTENKKRNPLNVISV